MLFMTVVAKRGYDGNKSYLDRIRAAVHYYLMSCAKQGQNRPVIKHLVVEYEMETFS